MSQTIEKEVEAILIEQYERFYRLAFQYVRNEQDALDMVQESAYRAMKNCGKVRDSRYLFTWIYRIVINTCLDHLRKTGKEQVLETIEEPGYVEAGFDREEQEESLRETLEQLDERDRTVVVLRYFEELKLEEIAQVMDENTNTVKTRLYRALRKLRVLYVEKGCESYVR